jgi:hypothetical protein
MVHDFLVERTPAESKDWRHLAMPCPVESTGWGHMPDTANQGAAVCGTNSSVSSKIPIFGINNVGAACMLASFRCLHALTIAETPL